ncbi:glycosyltransferase [Marinospirillum insulare]|uniref:Glycosyltransferase 2-like domain-containing protein n=1 Tax=Marinospirillum insulare TaxID=217169 RepID=A0ABQ5ZYG4_9GAMM|nr:glycosyltransferase [Marinospirillum insulare]GLR65014.1 hypothetical protein GCM10007878_24530 [Marinospirillum insulare]
MRVESRVVNDGSTDGSLNIINLYKGFDDRVKILNQENQGAAVARNNGIVAAKGRYLSILDSDDLFDSNMLEEMFLHAEKTSSKVVLCPFRYIGDIPTAKRGLTILDNFDINQAFDIKNYPDQVFQVAAPNAWSKLFKRDFILKNNIFFQDLKSCNDIYFSYVAIVLSNRTSFLYESYVSYRDNRNGSISSTRGECFNNIIYAMQAVKKILIREGVFNKVKRSFLRRSLNCFAYEIQFVKDADVNEFIKSSSGFLEDNY